MLPAMIEKGGPLILPILGLSVLVLGMGIERLLFWGIRRKSRTSGDPRAHDRLIQPLGNFAVSLGLLGSVVGMIEAFGDFNGSLDAARIGRGLGTAFYTTELGLGVALAALLICYLCDQAAARVVAAPNSNT